MNSKALRRYLYIGLLLAITFCQTVWADEPIVRNMEAEAGAALKVEKEEEGRPGSSQDERLEEAKRIIRQKKVGKYGMVPIYAGDLVDGTYEIKVESTSPFFKIIRAELFVDGGSMYAKITISSLSYQYVYPGTAREAEKADNSRRIGYEETDGKSTFTIPVEALDQETDCAAFSKKRQMWYDRQLVFDASSLPKEALKIELPDYELIEKALRAYQGDGSRDASDKGAVSGEAAKNLEPVSISRSDGEYSIEVDMTGGSGRAGISSPTLLIVRDGRAYARLIWSSAYYDYMVVDGVVYDNLTTDGGNSVFEIPITVMDDAMSVIADTTAMGDPVEIEYTLTFYAESIGAKGLIPQEAAKKVLMIAGIMIIAGGILNYFVKKERK